MHIHPDLEHLARPLTGLTPDPKNARRHDERNIRAVMDSLREHGQRKPVVAQRRKDGGLVVIAGNATCEAARRLGWDAVAAVVVDDDDKQAKAYAIRDNRTAELAEWSLPQLGEDLRFLVEQGVQTADLGWESFEAEPLMQAEWQPPQVSDDPVVVPDKRVALMFERAQWEELKSMLGAKPTGEQVLEMVRAGMAVS